MGILSSSAVELAKAGANLEITAEAGYLSDSVKQIIKIATEKGRHVTVHASPYLSSTLKEMVTLGNGNVTIVL